MKLKDWAFQRNGLVGCVEVHVVLLLCLGRRYHCVFSPGNLADGL